jgi:putative ABC transport system permease protein
VFAGLAIFIAGLGLFGLAAFTARQRQQEIGIRKAVGASVLQIVRLLSTDFAALVGVAIVVAVPVAYVGLNRWLDTFAYRIDLGMGVFVLAGGSALLVALIAVGLQALRAAQTDPAEVLRSE